jgi:CheY-like chemotaxis protein/two-component sensor histidine kinase
VSFVLFACWLFAWRYGQLRDAAIERMVLADRAKTAFLATISHEIRTPMNGVLGMTEVMLQGELPEEQRERLGVVQRSGQLLVSLVNDLLDITRLESGMLAIERAPFELQDLLSDVRALAAPLAAAKGLQLDVELDPALPRAVLGDSHRLAQVLNNLVSNAVKFTTTGSVRLAVSREVAEQVRFSIVDTGMGIDAAVLPRLFSLFQQADSSTTRRFGGSGIGLALSQQLVGLMGARIAVASTPGQGSTFSFSLALPRSAQPAPRPSPQRPGPLLAKGSDRVLVVDDNPINLRVAAALVERAGFQVDLARNGQEALDAVSRAAQPFAVVLMDCHMPVMDGFEATERIRALHGPAARTPIIALTASAAPEDLAACQRAGMNDCVTKPVSFAELKAAIGRQCPG